MPVSARTSANLQTSLLEPKKDIGSGRWAYKFLAENVRYAPTKKVIEDFRIAFKNFGYGRDRLLQHVELLHEFICKLGPNWKHVPDHTIRELLTDFTKNPRDYGYLNGEWKTSKSNNHGATAGYKTRTLVFGSKDCERRIQEPDWPALKEARLDRDGRRCRSCPATDNLEVHHIIYDRMRSPQEIDDLTTLCRSCHKIVTAARRDRARMERMADKILKDS